MVANNVLTPRRVARLSRMAVQEAILGYLFAGPWLAGFFIFTLGPMLASIIFSLWDWNFIREPRWVGLGNYREMLADEVTWHALRVTATYAFVTVPLGMCCSLALALLLNERLLGTNLLRTIYYLPAVVSGVAVAYMFGWMFNPTQGLVNSVLAKIGIEGPKWLTSTTWALPTLMIMSLWGVGGGMLIYLAGLQGIPTSLYEAAMVDGAGRWRRFVNVTLPMLSPTLLFNLVMGIIGSFQVFTTAYVLTEGGPGRATLFYVLHLYRNAFIYFRAGYSSALAWLLFVIILALTLLVFRSSPAWVYYEGTVKGR